MGATVRWIGHEWTSRGGRPRDGCLGYGAPRPPRQSAWQAVYSLRVVAAEVSDFDEYVSTVVTWAREARRRGLRAVKIEVTPTGPYAHKRLRASYERMREPIGAVRDALGPDVDLMVDVQYAFPDADTCLATIRDWADGLLPPGFDCAQPDRLKTMMPYNPAQARRLLAEAGFSDGEGFPRYTMYLRAASPEVQTAAQAIQAMLKQNLNVEIGIQNMERKIFMSQPNKCELPLVLIPWELDYYDASNFMKVYRSGGRHPWKNAEYDQLVTQADSLMDHAKRCDLYRKAEDILVGEPGAVFLWHPLVTQLWRPWVRGDIEKPNKLGIVGWQEAFKGGELTRIYIGNNRPA